MALPIVWMLISLAMLTFGAEALVRGSASLALRAGLSPLMVGLTIVAFGTSAPELFVSLKASLDGAGDICFGNVVGSNIFNIGMILGLAALLCPIPVHLQVLRVDGPLLLAVTLFVPWLLRDGALGRGEAFLLFAGMVAYTKLSHVLAKREEKAASSAADPLPRPGSMAADLAWIALGLVVLVWGSRLLVHHAVSLARLLDVPDAVIGLTLVAAGTSMPELATSVVAALRRQPDIAIGNVIGSNLFNLLGILGAAGLVAPFRAPGVSLLDLATLVLLTALLLPLLHSGRRLLRMEGLLLLLVFLAYLAVRWPTSA